MGGVRQLPRSGRDPMRKRADAEMVRPARGLRRVHLGSMLHHGAKSARRLTLASADAAIIAHAADWKNCREWHTLRHWPGTASKKVPKGGDNANTLHHCRRGGRARDARARAAGQA